MYQWNADLDAQNKPKEKQHHRIPPTSRTPEVFFAHDGAFDAEASSWYFNTIYRREQERGYAGLEDLWCPGAVKWKLAPGQSVHFVCSMDPIDLPKVLAKAETQRTSAAPPVPDTVLDTLVRAAEQFDVDLSDEAAQKSVGVMTQFPWSAPSVRDALVAMPGLLLARGKFEKSRSMLECLAGYLHGGLIP